MYIISFFFVPRPFTDLFDFQVIHFKVKVKLIPRSILHRYLYYPWCSSNKLSQWRKLSGSMVCFTFIWLWHGPSHLFVLVWSLLNFVGVSVEALCKEVNTTETVQRLRVSREVYVYFSFISILAW